MRYLILAFAFFFTLGCEETEFRKSDKNVLLNNGIGNTAPMIEPCYPYVLDYMVFGGGSAGYYLSGNNAAYGSDHWTTTEMYNPYNKAAITPYTITLLFHNKGTTNLIIYINGVNKGILYPNVYRTFLVLKNISTCKTSDSVETHYTVYPESGPGCSHEVNVYRSTTNSGGHTTNYYVHDGTLFFINPNC